MASNFIEIPLGQIGSNPLNPRKEFKGQAFDELVASIRQKGVIEPIIVRPVDKPTPYEIVAGERRFRAAGPAGLEKIPAVVRELSDDEAYEFMIIENLQREDLTELEEAQSFKGYADRHGESGAQEIAEKTGIRPQYVRTRIAVLSLPADILEAWRKGKLSYSHLEQFLRISDPRRLREIFKLTKMREVSVADLKREINQEQIPLAVARFDIKIICPGCRSNSAVQRDLFDLGEGKAACLDPKCFKGKQGEWFKEHWAETAEAKRFKTRGARFDSDVHYDKREIFHEQTPEKCLGCDSFVSLVDPAGRVRNEWGEARACIGDKKCFKEREREARAKERGEKKKDKEPGKGPRVSWHGEFFRNVFFRKRVPEILEELKPEDPKVKTLLVMCLAHANREAKQALAKKIGCRLDQFGANAAIYSKLLALPPADVPPIFREVVKAVVLEGQDVREYGGFGSLNRRMVADFLGVKLEKEWTITDEYLQKKTKNEILAFGKKSGLFTDAKVKDYLEKKLKRKPGSFEKLKKSELIEVILKSGVELIGRVPAEILSK